MGCMYLTNHKPVINNIVCGVISNDTNAPVAMFKGINSTVRTINTTMINIARIRVVAT